MKRYTWTGALFAALLLMTLNATDAYSQGPRGRSFGFGFQAGEPIALTFRIWSSRTNSWDFGIGESYLGRPHVYGGYLWHFPDAFHSRIVFLYAGVGAAIGFNSSEVHYGIFKRHGNDYWYYNTEHNTAVAIRGAFGLNIIPNRTPLDLFLELDPLMGVSPGFGMDWMMSIGIRFYP